MVFALAGDSTTTKDLVLYEFDFAINARQYLAPKFIWGVYLVFDRSQNKVQNWTNKTVSAKCQEKTAAAR
jgi:hypothetical protein